MTFDTEESLDRFIASFEDGAFPGKDWKHAEHLVIATCYVMQYGRDEALNRARINIAKYNESQGGKNTEDEGYHETLTVFWIDAVASAIPQGAARTEAVRSVVESLGAKRDLWRDYYSFDLVKAQEPKAREARATYIPPDRKPHLS